VLLLGKLTNVHGSRLAVVLSRCTVTINTANIVTNELVEYVICNFCLFFIKIFVKGDTVK
jgi:hypothetical protein